LEGKTRGRDEAIVPARADVVAKMKQAWQKAGTIEPEINKYNTLCSATDNHTSFIANGGEPAR
jgi:hypothetical protein